MYPSSFVDISSVLYEQPYNISVTISCSLKEWSVLQNIKRKNNEKVESARNFLQRSIQQQKTSFKQP